MLRYTVAGTASARGYRQIAALLSALIIITFYLLAAPLAIAGNKQADWEKASKDTCAEIKKIPEQVAAGDEKAVVATTRVAYDQIYRMSGLKDQIVHRVGAEQAEEFGKSLIGLRKEIRAKTLTADSAKTRINEICANLDARVKALSKSKALNDQWTRVGNGIKETAEAAVAKYKAGDKDKAFHLATDAYLGHYESMGLEKATIALVSLARVTDVEAAFRQLRVDIKEDKGAETVQASADKLISMVMEDAEKLDKMTSKDSAGSGWGGFVSSFIVLLREGAEALLVIAAVITYLMKAKRRDQLPGVIVGIVLALLVSAGLAVLFSILTASTATGLSQELIEGITGIAAVLMLIYVSNWILSKSHGEAWSQFIKSSVEAKSGKGAFSLWTVAFLAVLREGSETILFFQPIFAATKTGGDKALVWFGVLAAAVALAILFALVWIFGVRLPLKPFFQWTSFLLAFMAITITGGAIKELQDAFPNLDNILNTPLNGVPTISFLGLHPSVQTIVGQVIVAVILVALAVIQHKLAAKPQSLPDSQESVEKTGENVH